MAVLPTINHAQKSLHLRAAAANGLSGGAIAGIVVGSIFGLLVLLTIFWICRLGSNVFIKARSLSTSVVDKAEKGHARAKDLYTAGRERQCHTRRVHNETHYEDPPLQEPDECESSQLPMARRPDTQLPCLGQTATTTIPSPVYKQISDLGASSECDTLNRLPSSDILSPGDVKPAVVDAKRILGIDDASYLEELPSHYQKNCDLTAAPTRMASGYRLAHLRRHERSPADLTLQRRMMDKIPVLPSGIELPDEIDTTFMGTEIKYRRVSELTGSESPLSPSSSSVRYYNHNHDPPISRISPDHMPGELYSPPSDDLGTTSYFVDVEPRRSGSIVAKTADDEVAGTNITERSRSRIPVCVNPWDVEHQPNPVIFAHLSSLGEAIPKRDVDGITVFAPKPRAIASSREVTGMLNPTLNSFEKLPALYAHTTILDLGPLTTLQAIDIETSDDMLPTLQSSTSESSADDISPVTVSEGTLLFEGKQRCLGHFGTVELINFAATTLSSSSNYENSTAVSSQARTRTNSDAIASSSQASSLSSPPNVSTPAVVLASPASTEASSDPAYPCPACRLSFRTPGLRRNHQNRKHNLRYPCKLCESRFGLRADLLRHQNNVHRDDIHIIPTKLFRCPNVDCTAPGKAYARKDNFKRHVQRCDKTITTAISLQS